MIFDTTPDAQAEQSGKISASVWLQRRAQCETSPCSCHQIARAFLRATRRDAVLADLSRHVVRTGRVEESSRREDARPRRPGDVQRLRHAHPRRGRDQQPRTGRVGHHAPLRHLRHLARDPPRVRPLHRAPLTPAAKIASALKSYDAQVADTEADVERLGAVMDDAERALDAALARNRTLTAAARSRRDDEMSELRATIDAKDRAIDSLRETLTATRRALESRVTVAEDALAVRDAELRRVEDRAAADRRDKREAESRANDEAAACARAREETRRAEAALEEAKEARARRRRRPRRRNISRCGGNATVSSSRSATGRRGRRR